jgi:mxaD protein
MSSTMKENVMRKLIGLLLSISAITLTGCATGGDTAGNVATTLHVEEKVMINAPADKVWAKVNNFGDLGAWHPAVASTEIIEGNNNEVGVTRLLTLQDGGKITEKLIAYDDAAKTYSYVIIEGVLPVSGYASTIQVIPTGSGSEVVWAGNFKRKDRSANPTKGQDDEAATTTISAVYRGGLDNLKKITE